MATKKRVFGYVVDKVIFLSELSVYYIPMAKLYYRHSPMNAGKSTNLLQVAHNYERNGYQVAVLKSSIDTKGDDMIVSRIGASRQVDVLATPETDIYKQVINLGKGAIACTLVDEAQFLTREQVMHLRSIVDNHGIPVIAYGLRTDFQRKAFPGSIALFELADKIEEIRTVCRCLARANFNARIMNGVMVFEGDQVAIDGEAAVTYVPLCSPCYANELQGSTVNVNECD